MVQAENIANKHWEWQSCKSGMIYRNTAVLDLKRGQKQVSNKQALCSKTCFWFDKGVCRYSDITNHICTKDEQESYYVAREIRLMRAN